MAELNTNNIPHNEGSAIKASGFSNFMSTLFGWGRSKKSTLGNGIEFKKVDISSKEQRIGQSFINNAPNLSAPLNQKLEELFNLWLNDNTDKYAELSQRLNRINQLDFMVQNDPYVSRTVDLYADESCQLDSQDTIINIETPDLRMTKDMYKLLSQWGLTQNRIRETLKQLAIYGDAFWANTVTEHGVERIIPLQQLQVTDRIEFNPVKALEAKKRREGSFAKFVSNNYLIDMMFQTFMDGGLSDFFDTKLFGFNIDSDLTVPPWSITHFRVGAEGSQFYPWGTSPIIQALAPYKQTQTSIALQALGREMSFPITTYEVKTDPNMDEATQFALVNRVREAYDNIGTSQKVGNSEVYTVNTKIWLPKELLSITVHKPETGAADNVEDIKLYQDRTAIALGIPKTFYGEQGWSSLGNGSGKSLMYQYKPFARKCFTLQNAFLEGLADLFRIHFAITGQYDFRVPFTLSMKYPVLEEDNSIGEARRNSVETAKTVIGLVKSVIGASDSDPLPADIVRDIIGKYTFLNPEDIVKWTKNAKYFVDYSEDTGSGGPPSVFESKKNILDRLREYDSREKSTEEVLRESLLNEAYEQNKDEIYFKVLTENCIDSLVRSNEHVQVFSNVNPHSELMLEVLNSQNSNVRMRESFKEE